MRYIRITFSLLAVALQGMLCISCEEENFKGKDYSNNPITLSAGIVQQYDTRASDNGFADGDRIGVFVVNYKDGKSQQLELQGNHADNVMFTYSQEDDKWTGAYQLYWKDKSTPVDAYGYYPFDNELSSVTAYPFNVHCNQRNEVGNSSITGYQASDFLWAKAEGVVPTAAPLLLRHKHIMAGIEVTLVEGAGFSDGEWAALEKQVTIESTHTGSTINLQDGIVSVDTSSDVQSIIPQKYGDNFRAILVPQSVSAGEILLSITAGTQGYRFNRNENMVYRPGKLHKFTLSVSKPLPTGDYEFKLLQESIVAWQGDRLSHNGAAREYITVHVEEGEYIGDAITRMGIAPSEIINLKLTGAFALHNFSYIRENMPQLEAINMRELRIKGDVPSDYDDCIVPGAFENMRYLQSVIWPEKLKRIYDRAFAGCNLRGSLILPEGLEYIGEYCFKFPNSFSGEIYIPSTVKHIGDYAFSNHEGNGANFTGELSLPSTMDYLGTGAFSNCGNLTGKIIIPEGLTEVYPAWATNMTGDIVVPQGVKIINGIGGKGSSLHLPEGVEKISRNAFLNQTSLKGALNLPNSIKIIEPYAFYNTGFSHIKFPENLPLIDECSFAFNGLLQDTLTIPASVKQINRSAFLQCRQITAIVLPPDLETIQETAFGGCYSVNYIRCMSKVPPVLQSSYGVFSGINKENVIVVVPEGCVDAYRNAEGWKEFKRISTYFNFICRPMNAKLLNRSNTRKIILNADGNWSVTHCPRWATPSATSGYKKTELIVEIDELTRGAGNRCDSIVFTLAGKVDDNGNPITCYYKIEQFDSEYAEDSEIQLQQATKEKGINIIFTGDGYDAEDIATGSFIKDINEGVEYFFGVEPYKSYKEYFNVYADVAMSYDSGVCDTVDIWRETKFNTTYGAGNNGRLKVDFDAIASYIVNDVENSVVVREQDNNALVICILNSDAYEGVTQMHSGGSAIAAVPHSRNGYPNDFRGLIQHEAGGHGFGKLGDEYIYHRNHIDNCPCTCCEHKEALLSGKSMGWYRNLSVTGKYSDIEWRHLVFDDRYQDIVDIYEGGWFHGTGVFRSEVNSCMNDNVPYFSTISRQIIVERIKMLAGETFDFEEFVAKDSREFGDKFITRSGEGETEDVLHPQPPVIKKGSLLDYIKK